jgi:hypothetical protein
MDEPADQDRPVRQHQVHFEEAESMRVVRPRVDREALLIELPVLRKLRQPDIHSRAHILSTWLPTQFHTGINGFTVSYRRVNALLKFALHYPVGGTT